MAIEPCMGWIPIKKKMCNNNLSQKYLWKDGIHFDDKGTNVQEISCY